jgi:PAT family beta-lactamase induction signal transducer AmpG
MFSKIITDIRFFKIFALGIVSGMPFAILYTTIIAWMNEFAIDFTIVALMASARMPYSLKFLWSPFLDYFSPPILGQLFGRRRSWMMLTSLGIAAILFYMATTIPSNENFYQLFFLSVAICFLAATYDISYDALRIEMLSRDEQAIATAHVSLAYRIGVILTGAIALLCAHHYGWQTTFLMLSWLFLIGAVLSCIIQTPNTEPSAIRANFFQSTYLSFKDLLIQKHFTLILCTIIIYKIGDAMLAFVGIKFYREIGFSLEEIAYVVKTCGLIATIIGSYVGGIVMMRLGQTKGLLFCGAAQMTTNLGYIWLHHAGHDINVFLITNICENFTGGMGAAALGGYIATLCNIKFAANQFALLSSCSAFMNSSLTSSSGYLVEKMGWDMYFVFTAVVSLPALFLLLILNKKINEDNSQQR